MKNILICLSLALTLSAFGEEPVVTTNSTNQMDDEKPFNHRKSHWVSTFGFENTKYEVPFVPFDGTKNDFEDDEQLELFGGRLGIGYEAYMGAGFILGGGVSAYYLGTAFQNAKEAFDPAGEKYTEEKNRGQFFGGEAYGHAGWMFDFKTKNPFLGEMTYMAMELFGEASIGRGQTYFSKDYDYDTSVQESYKATITESFTSASVSGGVNFLSRTSGFFLNLKVTRMLRDVDERKTRAKADGGTLGTFTPTEKDPSVDPITVFTLGGGYKF